MSAPKTVGAPVYDHIHIGDSIVVTAVLKAALTVYQNMSEDAVKYSVSERQAQAAQVVTALGRKPRGAKS